MSLLKKLVRGAGKLVGKVASAIPGPIGTAAKVITGAVAGVKAAQTVTSNALPALRSLPGIGTIKTIGSVTSKVAGAAATGAILYDAFGNAVGQRRRSKRINPLNHKALNRALRRVCMAKDLADRLNKIEIKGQKTAKRKYAC